MSLTKEQILQADDIKTETVDVPEWGGKVTIRMMTGTQRDAFEASIIQGGKTDMQNIRAKLCAAVMVDGDGKPLFTVHEVNILGSKCAIALDRIFSVAQKMNGLSGADIKELEKNSNGQSDVSTSV